MAAAQRKPQDVTAVSKRKPRGEGHQRRGEILKAAKRIYAEEGIERATMRRVAEMSKLSTAAIYIYFKDKEALLAAIRDETFAALEACTAEAADQATDPRERVLRRLQAYLAYAMANPDVYRITFHSRLIRTPRRGRPTTMGQDRAGNAFTSLLRDVSAVLEGAGHHDEARAYVGAEAAWASIHGLAMLAIDVPDFPRSGVEQALAEIGRMVLSGLTAGSTPTE
jgi:AcrR family transcriptional regulator